MDSNIINTANTASRNYVKNSPDAMIRESENRTMPVDSYKSALKKEPIAQIFDPNPIVTMKDRKLRDMDDSKDAVPPEAYFKVPIRNLYPGTTLDGKFVTTSKTKDRANDPDLQFVYDRSDNRFNEVMAYYHMDTSQNYIQSLGFNNVNNRQVIVDANGTTDDNSFYVPWENTITFGTGGVDDAEDADIILHEYGHSILHSQIPGFSSAGEPRTIGEGFSDYWSTSYFSSRSDGFDKEVIGNWDATAYSKDDPPALRRIDSALTYEDKNGDVYHDGPIWASSLWQIFNKIGKKETDKIVLESHFMLSKDTTLKDAARAIIEADKRLNNGTNFDTIFNVFKEKKFFKSVEELATCNENSKEYDSSMRLADSLYGGKPEDIAEVYVKEIINKTAQKKDLRIEQRAKGIGADYIHFQQYYKGIPVEGTDMSVIVNKNGKNQDIFNDTTISESCLKGKPIKASLTKENAIETAIEDLKCEREIKSKKTTLVYFSPNKKQDGYELAWKVEMPLEKPLGDWKIYVSATTGKIIAKENQIVID